MTDFPNAPGLNMAPNSWSWHLDRLRRAASRAQAFNPEDAAVIAGVTATVSSTADTGATKETIASSNQALFNFMGGKPSINDALGLNNRLYYPSASVYPTTGGGMNNILLNRGDYNQWTLEAEIITDSPKVQFKVFGTTTRSFRVRVNGQYVSKTPTAFTVAAGINYVIVDLSALGGINTVRLECDDFCGLYSVFTYPTSNFGPSPKTGPTVLMGGDSYTEGQSLTYKQQGWAPLVARRMGWDNLRIVAVGSTGYLATSGGTRSKMRDQLPKWLEVNSDIDPKAVDAVVVANGYNDYSSFLTADIATEAALCLRAIRAQYPNAWIPVIGPWSGSRGPDALSIANEQAIFTALSALNDPHMSLIPQCTDPAPWIYGTGKVGATNSSGNSDTAIDSGGTHPTVSGHAILAARATAGLRAALTALSPQ